MSLQNSPKDSKIIQEIKQNRDFANEIKHTTEDNSNAISQIKRSLNLDYVSDNGVLLYIILAILSIQKLSELYSLFFKVINVPKNVAESYNFITKEDVRLRNKLDDLMQQLLGITCADRIAIAKIHNGTYDVTGAHQMKFSVVYEVVSDRGVLTKETVQNIDIDYIKEEILLGSYNNYERITRSDLDSACDLYLDKIGIIAKDYKLLSINKIIYGIIDIQYISLYGLDFIDNKALENRVMKITSQIEDCLQSIILKRNWAQKLFSKVFKLHPIFK
jgi:hypothetical protein